MTELCIIPCGNKKIWSTEPQRAAVNAGEAYTGTFHRLCKAYAESFFNDYVILSAKHGFMHAEDAVPGPYNISFSMKNNQVISIKALKRQLKDKSLHTYDRYVVLTGKKYVPVLDKTVPETAQLVFPLLHCKGIGFMQRELKESVACNAPLHHVSEPVRRQHV